MLMKTRAILKMKLVKWPRPSVLTCLPHSPNNHRPVLTSNRSPRVVKRIKLRRPKSKVAVLSSSRSIPRLVIINKILKGQRPLNKRMKRKASSWRKDSTGASLRDSRTHPGGLWLNAPLKLSVIFDARSSGGRTIRARATMKTSGAKM